MRSKYVEEYLTNIGLSQKTIKIYQGTLYEFIKWFNINFKIFDKNLKLIQTSHINTFMALQDNNSYATKKRKFTTLKTFFDYLIKNDYININPCLKAEFKRVRQPRRVSKSFTENQCRKLLDNIETTNKTRDKMIVELFMHTGLRLSELTQLNVNSIQSDNSIVIGKGEHERHMYLNDYIKSRLSEYLSELNIANKKDIPLFFSSQKKNEYKRLHVNTIQKMLSMAEKKAGLRTGVHILRHTFATLLYQNNNVDIVEMQRLLGHKNISTTEIYVSVADDRLKKLVNNNPLAKK